MFAEKVVTSIAGLGLFGAHFAASLLLLLVFTIVYSLVTPYKEFELIGKGNTAAACSFTGALLGFAIPLASAVVHSVGLIDMVIWGFIALAVQVVTFFVVKLVFPALVADIPAGQVSKGLFLGAVSLVVGILNAASMTS